MATQGALRLRVSLAGAAVLAVALSACHPSDPNAPKRLSADVSITGLATADRMKPFYDEGYRGFINTKLAANVPGPPDYADMRKAAQDSGLAFSYVPVKAGAISPGSVKILAAVLRDLQKPIVLYGERPQLAANVWALAEASRPDGLDANAIEDALKSAGLSADAVRAEVASRVAARKH
jgi:uncharacterized protein (TIGR01244 family)